LCVLIVGSKDLSACLITHDTAEWKPSLAIAIDTETAPSAAALVGRNQI